LGSETLVEGVFLPRGKMEQGEKGKRGLLQKGAKRGLRNVNGGPVSPPTERRGRVKVQQSLVAERNLGKG